MPPSPSDDPSPSRRRVVVAFGVAGGGVLLAAAGLAAMAVLFISLSWPHRELPGDPAFGINVSCNYAEYLLLEYETGPVPDDRPGRVGWCADTLVALLDSSGARFVRLSVEWSQVEPEDGRFDFALVDALLAAAASRDARVLLTVGMKAQRHPEFYLPGWAWDLAGGPPADGAVLSDIAPLRQRALRAIDAVVRHASSSPAIEAWAAENEPFIDSHRAHRWSLGADYVAAAAATIRAADPERRPVLVAHARHFVFDDRWRGALAVGDILGASLYPYRNGSLPGLDFAVPILELGPLTPNYAYEAREARAAGRDYWLTELQAEPWEDNDIRRISPQTPAVSLSPGKLRKNLDYARRTGASRVYLWGAEWWLFQQLRYGDASWFEVVRPALAP